MCPVRKKLLKVDSQHVAITEIYFSVKIVTIHLIGFGVDPRSFY